MVTHKDLFDKLISDENIAENLSVNDDYEPDKYGNNTITMAFEGVDDGRKKGFKGMVILAFNTKGRLVHISLATCKKGKEDWQVASSGTLDDFKQYFTKVNQ
jgi:hypothetical protein